MSNSLQVSLTIGIGWDDLIAGTKPQAFPPISPKHLEDEIMSEVCRSRDIVRCVFGWLGEPSWR